MTSVLDLKTGTFTDYTLSPFDAVVAAYAQRERRDFSTWMYSTYHKQVTITKSCKDGISVVSCGNQSALAQWGRERMYHNHDFEEEKENQNEKTQRS